MFAMIFQNFKNLLKLCWKCSKISETQGKLGQRYWNIKWRQNSQTFLHFLMHRTIAETTRWFIKHIICITNQNFPLQILRITFENIWLTLYWRVVYILHLLCFHWWVYLTCQSVLSQPTTNKQPYLKPHITISQPNYNQQYNHLSDQNTTTI